MKSAWILCFLTLQHGCISDKINGHVQALESETECNKQMSNLTKSAKEKNQEILWRQCESTDAMLEEHKQGND